jgi:hypothetical protein
VKFLNPSFSILLATASLPALAHNALTATSDLKCELALNVTGVPHTLVPVFGSPESNLPIRSSVLSPKGQWLARNLSDGSGRPEILSIESVKTGKNLLKIQFAEIKYMQFMPNGSGIAVNARKNSTTEPAQLFFIPFSEESSDQKAMIVAGQGLASVPLVGSKYHGTSVSQIVDLPEHTGTLIIQDSTNTVETIRREVPGQNPVDISVMNRSATLVNRPGAAPMQLSYNGTVPREVAVNPKHSLLAIVTQNPLSTSNKAADSVIVVDTKDPLKILMQYQFKGPQIEGHIRTDIVLFEKVPRVRWSADGEKLLAFEATSGELVEFDLRTQKIQEVPIHADFPSTIEAAKELTDGRRLILRGELNRRQRTLLLKGYFAAARESLKSLGAEFAPQFEISINDSNFPGAAIDYARYMTGLSTGSWPLFEMNSGKTWVFVLPNHILLIDAKNPKNYTPIALADQKGFKQTNKISSVIQLSDRVLRLSDELHGVFDLTLP